MDQQGEPSEGELSLQDDNANEIKKLKEKIRERKIRQLNFSNNYSPSEKMYIHETKILEAKLKELMKNQS